MEKSKTESRHSHILKLIKENPSLDNVMKAIIQLEDEDGLEPGDVSVKDTFSNNQFLIETNNYWYKFYTNRKKWLDHFVREALAKEYQESGIVWNFCSEVENGRFFDFESRSKFRVATSSQDGPFEKVLLSVSPLFKKVEERLGFYDMLEQLKQYEEFSCVDSLKLTRTEFNKHNDYAYFNSQAILLDDADFCIVPVDEDARVVDVLPTDRFSVKMPYGEFDFEPCGLGNAPISKCDRVRVSQNILKHKIYAGWELVRGENHSENTAEFGLKRSNKAFSSVDCTSDSLISKVRPQYKSKFDFKHVVEIEMKGSFNELPSKNVSYYDDKLKAETNPEILTTSLTHPTEDDFWDAIEQVTQAEDSVWVITQLNPCDSALEDREFVNWSSHLKTIGSYYPAVNKLITVSMTKNLCETYLSGNIDIESLSGLFGAMIGFIPPSDEGTFPSRKLFRRFLLKFARDNCGLFEPCFLKHNSITNSFPLQGSLTHHNEGSKFEMAGCNHPKSYSCYCDCDGCMLCDIEQALLATVDIRHSSSTLE